jgi:aspartate-semialdehyde dehydrogenase
MVFVDLSGASKSTGAPVVALGVNDAVLEGRPRTVAAPHPIAFALASVLAPIERLAGIDEAEAVVLRPVSDFGEAGVEELHKQTVGLLSFTDTPREVFDRQVAFNIVPQFAFSGEAGLETRIAGEVARTLGWESPRLTTKILVAPVFHGHSFLVHVETRRAADRAASSRALAGTSGRRPAKNGGEPVEAAGQDDLRVVELAPDGLAAEDGGCGSSGATSPLRRRAMRYRRSGSESGPGQGLK